MSAGIRDFYRGDTRKYKVVLSDKVTGNPISVDGGTLYITFKKSKDDIDADAVLQKIINCMEADPAHPTGEIIAILLSTDTNIDPGKYYYDFQFVSSIGEVTTILPTDDDDGKVTIKKDMTRTS